MGQKERRQKHKDEFKVEILDAALALFAQEGYSGFSMRKLAARIDHSPTTIYLYFRDKDDLLYHICENLYATLIIRQQEIRHSKCSPEQMLREILLHYINYSLANPEQYKVVFFTNPQTYGQPEEFFKRETNSLSCWKLLCEVIEECMQSGLFYRMEVNTLAIVLWSAVHGLVSSHIFTKDFPMPNPLSMSEVLLEGLFRGYRP